MIRILLLCLFSLLSSPGLLFARDVVFYHTDNVGTPVAMTNSAGAVVWRAHDKPFGEEFQTTATPHNSRRFIGKEKDKETGLVYIGARYLDPVSGRFLQPDPVGPVNLMTGKVNAEMLTNPQRLNRYAYGLNNPYRYIDPDGEMAKDIEDGINPYEMTEGSTPRGNGYSSGPGTSEPFKSIGGWLKGTIKGEGRSANKLRPEQNAQGPHTTFKTDPQTAQITGHETWVPNSQNPTGWDAVQRTDLKGAPHINKQTGNSVPTPHTHGKNIPGGVRPAHPNEIPKKHHNE